MKNKEHITEYNNLTGLSLTLNQSLKKLNGKGKLIKEWEWCDYANNELKEAIVDFLNKNLPSMWPDDPFSSTITMKGLNDAWIVEYQDHIDFGVDSNKYRIYVEMVIVGNEACLND